jgi:ATP-dependent DNA helicase HFM1/MER3
VDGQLFVHKPGALKAIYLGPMRALVQEKVKNWQARFGKIGLTVRELTGDSTMADLNQLDAADIIGTTAEKFGAHMAFPCTLHMACSFPYQMIV